MIQESFNKEKKEMNLEFKQKQEALQNAIDQLSSELGISVKKFSVQRKTDYYLQKG